jgi:hypothetical protein
MNAITATPATPATTLRHTLARLLHRFLAEVRHAIVLSGAPYLESGLPPA